MATVASLKEGSYPAAAAAACGDSSSKRTHSAADMKVFQSSANLEKRVAITDSAKLCGWCLDPYETATLKCDCLARVFFCSENCLSAHKEAQHTIQCVHCHVKHVRTLVEKVMHCHACCALFSALEKGEENDESYALSLQIHLAHLEALQGASPLVDPPAPFRPHALVREPAIDFSSSAAAAAASALAATEAPACAAAVSVRPVAELSSCAAAAAAGGSAVAAAVEASFAIVPFSPPSPIVPLTPVIALNLPLLSALEKEKGRPLSSAELSSYCAKLPTSDVPKLLPTLVSDQQIAARLKVAAREIEKYFHGEPVTLVAIMTGGIFIATDLMRELNLPSYFQTIRASSYGDNLHPGQLKVDGFERLKLTENVVIIDDIFDSGKTMTTVRKMIGQSNRVKKVITMTMLLKDVKREIPDRPDISLFWIPNLWVIGYGLDNEGVHRGLKNVFYVPGAK